MLYEFFYIYSLKASTSNDNWQDTHHQLIIAILLSPCISCLSFLWECRLRIILVKMLKSSWLCTYIIQILLCIYSTYIVPEHHFTYYYLLLIVLWKGYIYFFILFFSLVWGKTYGISDYDLCDGPTNWNWSPFCRYCKMDEKCTSGSRLEPRFFSFHSTISTSLLLVSLNLSFIELPLSVT